MEKYVDVSVVIPYYKSNKTILRALNSILEQKVLPNEIIIIDDFSNTEEDNFTLNSIGNKHGVKVVKLKKNKGAGSARNVGMDTASSKYIAFLDSDDSWDENKLKIQYEIMEKSDAFISTHHTTISGGNKKKTNKVRKIKLQQQLLKNQFATRAVMLKNQDKYRFKEGKRYAEDFLLWTQILFDKNPAIYINSTLAYSYKNDFGDGGLTGDLKKMYIGSLDSYETLKNQNYLNNVSLICLKLFQSFKYIIRILRIFIRGKK